MVILDTCALIELCKIEPRLKSATLGRIDKGSVVLSVSFAEIALKQKLGKLNISLSAQQLYQHYCEIPSIHIIPIGCDEWFEAIALEWSHRDPADRLIVAYAKRHKATLVSSDRMIHHYYKNVIW